MESINFRIMTIIVYCHKNEQISLSAEVNGISQRIDDDAVSEPSPE